MFVISPREAKRFVQTYAQLAELGSLTPLPARSVFPAALLARSWTDLPARTWMIGGLLLSLVLLAWVSLVVPQRVEIPLRLTSAGVALEYQPAIRLMLLPVLNAFFVLADLVLGMFFYRRSEEKLFAYLLWGAGWLSPLLFLSAVFFLLRAS
jgi:hypothetical protein